MNWFHKLKLRLRALVQKEKLDTQMEDEMRSHVEMQTQENIEAGMNPEEARYAALRQFGWVESIKETCREQHGVSWIENLGQDIRYGARMLRKNLGFTAVAVLTLALGIGVNTAIFSVVNAVLLRPLPYRDPERLVRIASVNPSLSLQDSRSSGLNVLDWQRQSTLLESIGAFQEWDGILTFNGKSEPARVNWVTPNLMPMLGLKPVLGALLPDGEQPATGLVLPHGLWQHRFGGDPSVIGKATLCQS